MTWLAVLAAASVLLVLAVGAAVVAHFRGYPLTDWRLTFDRDRWNAWVARLKRPARHHPKPKGRVTSAARLTHTVPIRRPVLPPKDGAP